MDHCTLSVTLPVVCYGQNEHPAISFVVRGTWNHPEIFSCRTRGSNSVGPVLGLTQAHHGDGGKVDITIQVRIVGGGEVTIQFEDGRASANNLPIPTTFTLHLLTLGHQEVLREQHLHSRACEGHPGQLESIGVSSRLVGVSWIKISALKPKPLY